MNVKFWISTCERRIVASKKYAAAIVDGIVICEFRCGELGLIGIIVVAESVIVFVNCVKFRFHIVDEISSIVDGRSGSQCAFACQAQEPNTCRHC